MLISALEHGDRIAFLERDHGFLPARGGAAGAAARDGVAPHLHGADAGGRDAEQPLERVPDLVLVGLGVHLEGVHLAVLVGGRALLGHHRAHDDLVQGGHYLFPFFFGAGFFADLAVLFLAALALLFLAALGALFFAVLAGVAALVRFCAFGALASTGVRRSRSCRAGSSSAPSSRVSPVSAPSSTTTASAHRTSYAEACANGITSTEGRFRPLR